MDHGSLTIRVSRSTHGLLRELADRSGEAMTDIVDQAVRAYQRQRFWADYHAAYEAVKANPSAWADLQHEVESWDSTLKDGLEENVDGIEERGSG